MMLRCWAGIWVFRRCFRDAPWRPLFIGAILLSAGLSCLELVLIFQLNKAWGIPNLVFAMGDDLVHEPSAVSAGLRPFSLERSC